MKIEVIKHRLLIDGIWETIILSDNSARVYVMKNIIYSKECFEQQKDVLQYSKERKEQLEAIFNKDWSQWKQEY